MGKAGEICKMLDVTKIIENMIDMTTKRCYKTPHSVWYREDVD
uniref:Uncharacterized protein n=1 Tax=Anopheles maculatus TaxID=74869 RepID=A0A182SLJ7_9DIPT